MCAISQQQANIFARKFSLLQTIHLASDNIWDILYHCVPNHSEMCMATINYYAGVKFASQQREKEERGVTLCER